MSVYDTHEPDIKPGLWFKVAGGDSKKIRLVSEPAIFESTSKPDANGEVKISTRYAWVIWNQTDSRAQILQQSATFFNTVKAHATDEDWGDPTGYDFKISREGNNFNDTKYTVTASPNRDILSIEAVAACKEIDLLQRLRDSDYAQRVMWLRDWDAQSKQPAPAQEDDMTPPAKPDDIIIDDGAPVNLDDIPF